MDAETKVVRFTEELTALTNKYGIEIASCGCCNSPYLLNLDTEFHVVADTLKFDREKKVYNTQQPDGANYHYDGEMYNADGSKGDSISGWGLSQEDLERIFTKEELAEMNKLDTEDND